MMSPHVARTRKILLVISVVLLLRDPLLWKSKSPSLKRRRSFVKRSCTRACRLTSWQRMAKFYSSHAAPRWIVVPSMVSFHEQLSDYEFDGSSLMIAFRTVAEAFYFSRLVNCARARPACRTNSVIDRWLWLSCWTETTSQFWVL